MRLTDIDLHGYGEFLDAPAAFRCARYHLPTVWDYVYTNGSTLLRIQHDGSSYLQLHPPSGPALFRQERGQSAPSMLVWILSETQGQREAFTNFWVPTIPLVEPATEPDEYSCAFSPEMALYRVLNSNLVVETELWVPPSDSAIVMTVTIANAGNERKDVVVMPVLKPHLAAFSLAPWYVPHHYQTAAFCRLNETPTFWFQCRDPGGEPARRSYAGAVCDLDPAAFEVSADRFIGKGDWNSPEAVWDGALALRASGSELLNYGEVTRENSIIAQPPLAALEQGVSLAPGAKFEFAFVFGELSQKGDGKLPPESEVGGLARYLDPAAREQALHELSTRYAKLFAIRSLKTPDECLNRYVGEFLPLQLLWVSLLDRGWPSGMRGTRDAAQDATGAVPLDPELARTRLLEILACQRSDGWFLRQYSTAGPSGEHDARPYVDSGLWVEELLREYLCYTRDFAILDEELGWLDAAPQATVLEHTLRLFGYYKAPENIGEHGLCKIREGDWNDSINRAGLEGRGESVMVSCQAVLGLEQMTELLEYLVETGYPQELLGQAEELRAAAQDLRNNLLAHALNDLGYFNGVFTDAGQWVFSPHDPDGQSRLNVPVNSFAIIAGLLDASGRDRIFTAIDALKGPHGWRLFYPPIGESPIEKLGRTGQGDLPGGLSENGTVYNHGSHGFLGRAAWTAGHGTMLQEILRYMFSYDQQAHPIDVAKTAPYAVVNKWQETPGFDGQGGATFLSGSISTALRNCYQGMVGFRPGLRHLVIDPCIPADWEGMAAHVRFLGGRYDIRVHNPAGVECGVVGLKLDGQPVDCRYHDARLGRVVAAIPISDLSPREDHTIEAVLGE